MTKHPPKNSVFGHPDLPTPDPALSVFVNCPFDKEFQELRDAIFFTVVCCGYTPRAADESGFTDVPRIERIIHAIFTSNYSIHDLSRCKGEGTELLARFNMPLELGLAVGRRYVSSVLSAGQKLQNGKQIKRNTELSELSRTHRWLVLVPPDDKDRKFISDLGSFDLSPYNGKVQSLVQELIKWFSIFRGTVPGMKPNPVLDAFIKFQERKHALELEWGTVPWKELLDAARDTVPRL